MKERMHARVRESERTRERGRVRVRESELEKEREKERWNEERGAREFMAPVVCCYYTYGRYV